VRLPSYGKGGAGPNAALKPGSAEGYILLIFILFHLGKKVLHCHLLTMNSSLMRNFLCLNAFYVFGIINPFMA
jgi:hypothetical protein